MSSRSKSKRRTSAPKARKSARKAAQSKPPAKGTASGRWAGSSAAQAGRFESKQARIIALLRAPNGATIGAMMRATGWKPHSVRGFLAVVVRKKFGLKLVSTAAEGGRVYRIVDRTASSAPSAKMSQAA